MRDILDELKRQGKNIAPAIRVSGPQYLGLMNNPEGVRVLRVIDGNLVEDEPIGWQVFSVGQPIPILLGLGPCAGDFAVGQKKPTNMGYRYVSVCDRGKYYQNFTLWLYARMGELDPSFSPRFADREEVP